MSRERADGDIFHLGFDTWGSTETSIAWQGRIIVLLLRVMIDSGGVDISIMEMPGQDELFFHIFFATWTQERGM